MTWTKVVVPMMPDYIWCILEYTGVPMRSSLVNFGPKNYKWTLPSVTEGASEEALEGAGSSRSLRHPKK